MPTDPPTCTGCPYCLHDGEERARWCCHPDIGSNWLDEDGDGNPLRRDDFPLTERETDGG